MTTAHIYKNNEKREVKRNDKKILLNISSLSVHDESDYAASARCSSYFDNSTSFNLDNYYDKTKLKVSEAFISSWDGSRIFEVINPNDTIDNYLPTLFSIPESTPSFYYNDMVSGDEYIITNHTFVTFKEDIIDKKDERLKSLQKYGFTDSNPKKVHDDVYTFKYSPTTTSPIELLNRIEKDIENDPSSPIQRVDHDMIYFFAQCT